MDKLLILITFLLILSAPLTAYAENPLGAAFCGYSSTVTEVAEIITILLIIGMGIIALLGKLTWAIALLHIVGTAIIMGAPIFVEILYPPSTLFCT